MARQLNQEYLRELIDHGELAVVLGHGFTATRKAHPITATLLLELNLGNPAYS